MNVKIINNTPTTLPRWWSYHFQRLACSAPPLPSISWPIQSSHFNSQIRSNLRFESFHFLFSLVVEYYRLLSFKCRFSLNLTCFQGGVGLVCTVIRWLVFNFLFHVARLDHAEDLNYKLIGHQSVDDVRVNLKPVVLREVELGLPLVLHDLCLFSLLVEPDVGALVFISELLVVDCGLLDLHVDLNPLAQKLLHIFVVNQVHLRLFVRVKQFNRQLELQLAHLQALAIVNVLLVGDIK